MASVVCLDRASLAWMMGYGVVVGLWLMGLAWWIWMAWMAYREGP